LTGFMEFAFAGVEDEVGHVPLRHFFRAYATGSRRGPGGGSQPMPDGCRPEPGGWNRIVLKTSNLEAGVDALKKAGGVFRNDIVPARRPPILLEDPSGNLVELFEPASAKSRAGT
jgi:hypothetical protein